MRKEKYLTAAGRVCLVMGGLLLATAALYAASAYPSPGHLTGRRGTAALYNLALDLLHGAGQEPAVGWMAAAGLVLAGAALLLAGKRMR